MTVPPLPKHVCNALGCRRQILLKFLMCWEHRAMVPPSLQKDVWRTYFDGMRLNTQPRKRATDYVLSMRAAVQIENGDAIAIYDHAKVK